MRLTASGLHPTCISRLPKPISSTIAVSSRFAHVAPPKTLTRATQAQRPPTIDRLVLFAFLRLPLLLGSTDQFFGGTARDTTTILHDDTRHDDEKSLENFG